MPHTVAQFSPLKHLARGDVILRPEKLVLILKGSTTMQSNNQIKLITVPRIPDSNICPVAAIRNLLDLTPKGSNLPLFQFTVAQSWFPLTDNRVRQHFALILAKLQLNQAGFTFHSFRHSGATFTFNNDVTLQIFKNMAPGRWTVCGGTLLTVYMMVSKLQMQICLGPSCLLLNY